MSKSKSSEFASTMDQVRTLVKAGAPIIWVRTHEEERFMDACNKDVVEKLKRDSWAWSVAQGIVPFSKRNDVKAADGPQAGTTQPMKALEYIAAAEPSTKSNGTVYFLRDFHIVLQEPIPRKIRDMYNKLLDNHVTLVIVSPVLAHGSGGSISGVPPTLEKQIIVVDYDLPAREGIEQHVRSLVQVVVNENNPKEGETASTKAKREKLLNNITYTDQDYFDFSRALQGLTEIEIDTIVSTCIHHCSGINLDFLLQAKKQIVSRGEILEYIDVRNEINDIGGLDAAKVFFQDYALANSPEAEAFGVEALRGALLVGVPGTGKSALSKAIPTLWKLPLLRLDVGKVMTGLVGGSEGKMRQVINQVEAVAPCVTGDTKIKLASGREITAEKLYEVIHSSDAGVQLMGVDLENLSTQPIHMYTMLRRPAKNKKLLKITVGEKSITVTDNHKLFTQRGWVEAQDLTEDDQLLVD